MMRIDADGWKPCVVPMLSRAALVVLLGLPIAAALSPARAQDNVASNRTTGEKFKAKKVDGTLIYLPETVETSRLSRVKNQLVEVRGIISHFQGIKERYRFTTDDQASIIVVGNFPDMGGKTYWLRARVIEDRDKIALSEVQKWSPGAVAPPLPGSAQGGKTEGLLDGPNAPLVIGGGVLILAALSTLGAMAMRNKSAEQRRLLEQQLEEERRRSAEAQRAGNKGGARGDASGGPGGTVVAGGSGGAAAHSGGRPNARTVASRGTVKVEAGPNAPGTFPLVDGETRIGRKIEEHCTVVLDKDAAISSYHSSIIVTRDGRLVYEDKSSNGSVVDGQFVQRTQRDIQSGSQIKIGATTLVVELFAPLAATPPVSTPAAANPVAANDSDARRAPTVNIQMPSAEDPRQVAAATAVGYGAELEVTAGPEAGRRFPITKATTTLGREDRDILLGDSSVSRSHATITVREGRFLLSDDGSAHGTRVNGEALAGEREIRNGDQILLGSKTTIIFRSIA